MPFLADLDEAPRSRGRGMLIGLAIAVPVCLILGAIVLPRVRASVMSGAEAHDKAARERDTYMAAICGEGMDLERDEDLCGCVWATEYPGLDCLDRFDEWLVVQQAQRCGQSSVFDSGPGYCTCTQAVVEQLDALPPEGRLAEAAAGHRRCAGLDDALPPPPLQSMLRNFEAADAPLPEG